jgi:polysaccharide export outer membrane protein
MKAFFYSLLLLLALAPGVFAQATLRSGDTIEIRLAGVPTEEIQAVTAQYTVDDAGMLNLPYINNVKVGGLQPNQAQAAIEQKFKSEQIYTHPTVTIVIQTTSRFVNVGGSVRAPGRVPYTPDLTLMSTINAAGGFNDFADQKRIRYVHDSKVQVIDAKKIRKDPTLDLKVYPGDQLEVPQSIW